MSDDKRATLKKILLTAMTVGALGRIPGHKALAHAGALEPHRSLPGNPSTGGAPAPLPGTVDTNDDPFHDVFNNAWCQTFGDLFVDQWFIEIMCW